MVGSYNITLAEALDRHAPLLTKTISVRPRVPWYNSDIKAAKRTRRQAERKWRRTKAVSDLNIYMKRRNSAVKLMDRARQDFYTTLINDNCFDLRKLFKVTRKLL